MGKVKALIFVLCLFGSGVAWGHGECACDISIPHIHLPYSEEIQYIGVVGELQEELERLKKRVSDLEGNFGTNTLGISLDTSVWCSRCNLFYENNTAHSCK